MSLKIAELEAIPLERRLEKSFRGGTYSIDSRYTLVTQIRLQNGIVGQTFGGDEERYQKQITNLINGPFRELLLGQDVFDVERHWLAMFECTDHGQANRGIHTLDLANKAVIMQSIAAVDIALWDAIGKALELPLFKLLGGYRTEVPVIAIGGYYEPGKTELDLEQELMSYRQQGMAGIKLKVGGLSPGEDANRVKLARKILGDEAIIACDANQAWTVEQAVEFCALIAGAHIRWLEEPVRWFDQSQGLARIRERTGIPVVAGQGEISRFGCRDLVASNGVDILNVDATIAGGITEWRRVAAMASMFNVSMAHHEEPQVAIHLLASIPHGLYVEVFPNPERDPLWFELPAVHPKIVHGHMEVPTTPGLGIPLREEVIEHYRAKDLQYL